MQCRKLTLENVKAKASPEDEQKTPSFLESLSAATGWLNPFNLVRPGINKTLVLSAALLNTFGQATAKVSFFDTHGHGYILDCVKSVEKTILEKLHDTCHTRLAAADCLINPPHELSYGASKLAGEVLCTLKFDYAAESDRCVFDTLEKNVISAFGTPGDILLTTLSASIGILLIVIAIEGTRALYNERNKYKNLTTALAKNDVALLEEINHLALDANVKLPKDILIRILASTQGYNDDSYRDNYYNSPDNDPTPPHIDENEIRGKRAPFIRFWDTNSRKAARDAAVQQAWEDIRDNHQQRQIPALLFAPNETSDNEEATLLEVVVDSSSRY